MLVLKWEIDTWCTFLALNLLKSSSSKTTEIHILSPNQCWVMLVLKEILVRIPTLHNLTTWCSFAHGSLAHLHTHTSFTFPSFFLFRSATRLLLQFTLVVFALLTGFTSTFTTCNEELVGSCYSISTCLFEKQSALKISFFLRSSSSQIHMLTRSFPYFLLEETVDSSLQSILKKNKTNYLKKQSH